MSFTPVTPVTSVTSVGELGGVRISGVTGQLNDPSHHQADPSHPNEPRRWVVRNDQAPAPVSQEVLLNRAQALLAEWGAYQRDEPDPAQNLRYPSSSGVARMMADWGRRSGVDRRQPWAHVRRRRRVDGGGRREVAELPMVPERADRQTQVRHVRSAPEWPAHVRAFEAVMAGLPETVVAVAVSCYVHQHSTRLGAAKLKLSHAEYRRRLDRLHWSVVGHLSALDSSCAAQ